MAIIIAAALAAAQPAVGPTASAPEASSQMGQAGPKMSECCCCKDKMGKEHAGQDSDRMLGHHDRAGR